MSESDSFIEEVSEEVRRDRLYALMRRYGWIGILAVILIVGGAAYNEWSKARATAAAQAFGDAVMAALDSGDPAAGLSAISASGAQLGVLKLLQAEIATEMFDTVSARSTLEALAADPTMPENLRTLARMKAVILAGPDMDPAARDAVLAELALPGAPYRLLALEQQALALLEAGRKEDAMILARQILREPELTAGLQRRATELIVALGGNPDAT
jgi:hypothetical protein